MNIKDVENLAELARLELSDEEKKEILKDMEGILAYVKQIESIKIEEAKPKYNVYNTWREDEIGKGKLNFSEELITSQFPEAQEGFLKVKKIL